MASQLRGLTVALILSMACPPCEALLSASSPRLASQTPSTLTPGPGHHHLRMTNHPSYEQYITSDDDDGDEPFVFDSRMSRRESHLSKLAHTNDDMMSLQQRPQQQQVERNYHQASPTDMRPYATSSMPSEMKSQNINREGQKIKMQEVQERMQSKLPLEDLLSDARRQALHSDLEALAREANQREERIRSKLAELGMRRTSSTEEVVDRENLDVGPKLGAAAAGTMKRRIAEGVVPVAASVASLGGLAVFRDGMIKRKQKEAEVRQDIEQLSAQKRELAKRRDKGMLGGMISGVSSQYTS